MTKKIIYSLAILFTILFTVSSCKKDAGDKKADDDLAASAAGQYNMTYLNISAPGNAGGENLISNTLSGKVNIANKDKTTVDMLLSITDTEDATNSGSDTLKNVLLKGDNSAVTLYVNSTQIGTISNNELSIALSLEQEQTLLIKAKK